MASISEVLANEKLWLEHISLDFKPEPMKRHLQPSIYSKTFVLLFQVHT